MLKGYSMLRAVVRFAAVLALAGSAAFGQNGIQEYDTTLGPLSIPLGAPGQTAAWSAVSGCTLPPGMSIRNDYVPQGSPAGSNASVAGVITAPGAYNCVVQSGSYQLRLIFKITTLQFTNLQDLPDAATGVPYDYTMGLIGQGGGVTYSILSGGLPAGLTIDVNSGHITGTPSVAGTSGFVLQVNDGNIPISVQFYLNVTGPRITTTQMPNASSTAAQRL